MPVAWAHPQQCTHYGERAGWRACVGSAGSMIALGLMLLAFMPLVPGTNPLDGGGKTVRGAIEIAFLSAGIAMAGWSVNWREVGRFILGSNIASAALCFSLWAVITGIWSPNRFLTVAKGAEFAMVMLAVVLIRLRPRRPDRTRDLAAELALASVALVILLLMANVIFWGTPLAMNSIADVVSRGHLHETTRPRFVLAYLHPLSGADVLAVMVLCTLLSRWHWPLRLAVVLAGMAGIWMADARTSLAALGVALGIVAVRTVRDRRVRGALTMVALLGLAAVALWIVPALFDPAPGQNSDLETLNGRVDLWADTVDAIREYWLGGIGFYATRYALMDLWPWAGETHNSVLEVALGTGLVGVLIAGWFARHAAAVIWRADRTLLWAMAWYFLSTGMMDATLMLPSYPMLVLLLLVFDAVGRPPDAVEAAGQRAMKHIGAPRARAGARGIEGGIHASACCAQLLPATGGRGCGVQG